MISLDRVRNNVARFIGSGIDLSTHLSHRSNYMPAIFAELSDSTFSLLSEMNRARIFLHRLLLTDEWYAIICLPGPVLPNC